MKKELISKDMVDGQLVEQTLSFWFNNEDLQIRSPFPEYIRPDLKRTATQAFYVWLNGLSEGAEKELNDEMIGEKFEEILFEEGLKLVHTEDEKISINYPFLPRLSDVINANDESEKSVIIDRSVVKEDDVVFLLIKLEKVSDKTVWETKFELPK
ncbi:MAG: hypothetical protein ISP71_04435 [Flavobacteriales bacterium]|nr:hypothetical protein [Flavobacteriales bacterium]